jgi:hypothetical protein
MENKVRKKFEMKNFLINFELVYKWWGTKVMNVFCIFYVYNIEPLSFLFPRYSRPFGGLCHWTRCYRKLWSFHRTFWALRILRKLLPWQIMQKTTCLKWKKSRFRVFHEWRLHPHFYSPNNPSKNVTSFMDNHVAIELKDDCKKCSRKKLHFDDMRQFKKPLWLKGKS